MAECENRNRKVATSGRISVGNFLREIFGGYFCLGEFSRENTMETPLGPGRAARRGGGVRESCNNP